MAPSTLRIESPDSFFLVRTLLAAGILTLAPGTSCVSSGDSLSFFVLSQRACPEAPVAAVFPRDPSGIDSKVPTQSGPYSEEKAILGGTHPLG